MDSFIDVEINKLGYFAGNRVIDEKSIKELAESIKTHGLIEPIVVRPKKGPFEYEVVCGERRLKAYELLGLKIIRAVARDMTDQEAREIRIIENLQRKDLGPIEEAIALKSLLFSTSRHVHDISAQIGKSESYILDRIKLLKLQKVAQDALINGKIMVGHGLVLSRITDQGSQKELLTEILRNKYSVRRAENQLDNYTRSLVDAKFDKKDCVKCPHNGSRQQDLFDRETNVKGQCLNAGCYYQKVKEWAAAKVAKLKKAGANVMTEKFYKKKYGDEQGYVRNEQNFDGWGDCRKRLGENYTKKCQGCDKRVFIIIEEREGKEVREICLNARCYTALTCNRTETGVDKEERSRAGAIIDARDRFWNKLTPEILAKDILADALNLYVLVRELRGRMFEVLPKGFIKDEWSLSIEKLHKLGAKGMQSVWDKALAIHSIFMDYEDREYLAQQAGHSFQKDFRVDEDYLKAMTKAEISKLAKEAAMEKTVIEDMRALTKPEMIKKFLILYRNYTKKNFVPKEITKFKR